MKTGEIKMSIETLFQMRSEHDSDKSIMVSLHQENQDKWREINSLKIENDRLINQIKDTAKNMLNPYHYVKEHPNLSHMIPDDMSEKSFNVAFDLFLGSIKS